MSPLAARRGYGGSSGIGHSTCGTFATANLPVALRAVTVPPPSQRWRATIEKRATNPPPEPERTVRRATISPARETVILTLCELPNRAP